MGIAGEIAYENSNNKGLGTFHKELFNAISNFNKDILIKSKFSRDKIIIKE